MLIELKKQWIENYFTIFKWTWKYWILKALSKFRFVKDTNKLSVILLDVASDVFKYLHKAYEIENSELVFRVFEQYFIRIFSTPEYSWKDEKKELIEEFKGNKDFVFFYWIEKYKKYIENTISDKEIPLKEVKEEIKETKIDLSWLRIWLVFWNKKSVKGYENYIKKEKATDFIKQLWLKDFDSNFEILNEDFKKQKKLNANKIKNRFFWIGNKLDLILSFETDHHTKFYDSLLNNPEVWWRIIMNTKKVTDSNKSWQHFSHSNFEKMLKEWIRRYASEKGWDMSV